MARSDWWFREKAEDGNACRSPVKSFVEGQEWEISRLTRTDQNRNHRWRYSEGRPTSLKIQSYQIARLYRHDLTNTSLKTDALARDLDVERKVLRSATI